MRLKQVVGTGPNFETQAASFESQAVSFSTSITCLQVRKLGHFLSLLQMQLTSPTEPPIIKAPNYEAMPLPVIVQPTTLSSTTRTFLTLLRNSCKNKSNQPRSTILRKWSQTQSISLGQPLRRLQNASSECFHSCTSGRFFRNEPTSILSKRALARSSKYASTCSSF